MLHLSMNLMKKDANVSLDELTNVTYLTLFFQKKGENKTIIIYDSIYRRKKLGKIDKIRKAYNYSLCALRGGYAKRNKSVKLY